MRLHYDAESDYLYIKVADREAAPDAEEILPGIVADYDADGRLVGLEVEHASELFDLTEVELVGLPARVVARVRAEAAKPIP